MPIAERLGARSRCFVAPVGTKPNDTAAWKQIGWTDSSDFIIREPDEDLLTLQARVNRALVGSEAAAKGWKPATFADETPVWLRNDLWPDESVRCLRPYHQAVDAAAASLAKAAVDYSMPSRWVIGIDPDMWDASTFNERSKPMGLTKTHDYKSQGNEGRVLIAEAVIGRDPSISTVFLAPESNRADGVFIKNADSIPLALNVLGYDRDDIASGYINEPTVVGGQQANEPTPRTTAERNKRVATAIDYLRGADIFDRRQAEHVAAEEAAAVERKAKEEAEAARRKVAEREIAERHFRKARWAYQDAIIEAYESDTTPESTAKLQSALSSYETARRKFEGLPN